ncbi:MAG: hypothetical protein QOJ21_2763 [Solirubrobacteraceae bacterium]|jgi:type II secretory pathway pseudopilin PulG|nr:hypothetical protein [Solirubrobacteraceae bacterium]
MLRTRIRTVAAAQDGFALITAMILMTIMLGSTLALATFLDGQTQVSATQRVRESSFNLAEAALNQQVWNVGRDWPGPNSAPGNTSGLTPYPTCTETSTDARCPNPAQLRKFIPSPDADPGATWTTQVLDNGIVSGVSYKTFYADALLSAPVGYDANADGFVWVRASAILKQRRRTLVALVRLQLQQEDILQKAIVAGAINITNNGNKQLIDGGTGSADSIAVRCTVTDPASATCLGQAYSDSGWKKVDTQIQPFDLSKQQAYPVATAMSDEAILRFRETAKKKGTWVQDCASLPSPTPGGIVFAEGGVCNIDGTNTTSQAAPGLVINLTGSFTMGGNDQYHGVLYAANRMSSTNLALNTTVRDVLSLGGNPVIFGGVLIDGNGVANIGSSGGSGSLTGNIIFDGNAFPVAQTIANAGVIQNTWRELPKG